jgi:hypothetical protein
MDAPGKIVKVNDTHMHVYNMPAPSPKRKDTIVFLAGSGTECPTYDFKPLWQLLLGRYSMVVVERPGYGWSGQTENPRDIDTVLEETREALQQAGIEGPFIPAAHSLSGLEALYWAQKYPGEVSAIIGLDMAVPKVYDTMKIPKSVTWSVRLGNLFRRPIASIMMKGHPAVRNNMLDADEQAAMRHIIAKQFMSKNMRDEIYCVKENARKVEEGGRPSVPVLCCLSNDKELLKKIPAWEKLHRNYFSSNKRVKYARLSCGHYLHRDAPDEVDKAITNFLK